MEIQRHWQHWVKRVVLYNDQGHTYSRMSMARTLKGLTTCIGFLRNCMRTSNVNYCH